MNYRHHFHAGNFADVMKHVLLIRLLRDLQRKEKGFLCLDTHAGRGSYDLSAAATGDSLARKPEWPDGIGRLWGDLPADTPSGIREYVELVRAFDQRAGNLGKTPRFYPGSPCLAQRILRPVDRLALCERHPAECAALRHEFAGVPGVSVHESDGYAALRGMLPPPERRALILIDPPFEDQDEFARVVEALAEALRRFQTGVYAVWYPLTLRARVEEFLGSVRALQPPPCVAVEIAVAGPQSALKMKGCGVLVINPPWRFAEAARTEMNFLAGRLEQEAGGAAGLERIVAES